MVKNFRLQEKAIGPLIMSMAILYIFYYPNVSIDLTYFHGDDAGLFSVLNSLTDLNSIFHFIFYPANYKFRPIGNIQYFLEFVFFHKNYNLYIAYNIFLVIIINYLFLTLVSKSMNLGAYFVLSFILVTSKFFVYSLWNVTGSFESLALIIFLITVRSLIFEESFNKTIWLSLLLILTSERYLPVVFALPILNDYIKTNDCLLKSVCRKYKQSLIILLLYCLVRTLLDVPIFVGTQVDNIASSFSSLLFVKHFLKSILEVLGFTNAPAHLTGFQFPFWLDFSSWDHTSRYVFYFEVCLVLISILLLKLKDVNSKVLILIAFAMITAASVTFRLETRWLMPVYTLFLIIISRASSQKTNEAFDRGRFLMNLVIPSWYIFLLLSVIFNIYYLVHYRKNLYFAAHLDHSALWRTIF